MVLSYSEFFQITEKLTECISSSVADSEILLPDFSSLDIVTQKNGDLIVGCNTVKVNRKEQTLC